VELSNLKIGIQIISINFINVAQCRVILRQRRNETSTICIHGGTYISIIYKIWPASSYKAYVDVKRWQHYNFATEQVKK
jgi:hypothetical protein